MSLEDTIRVLERAPMFAEIGPDATRLLAFSGEEVRVTQGERLFQRGTPAEGAFVVMDGSMRLVGGAQRTAERLVGPGTLIGEMALLIPTERPCDAFAAEDAHLFSVPRPLFRRMLEEFPDIAAILRQRLIDLVTADRSALDVIGAALTGLDRRR